MTVGADTTTLDLRSISHSMVNELIKHCYHLFIYLNLGDKFNYKCCTYWLSKQVCDMVTAHESLTDDEIHITSNSRSNIRQLLLFISIFCMNNVLLFYYTNITY